MRGARYDQTSDSFPTADSINIDIPCCALLKLPLTDLSILSDPVHSETHRSALPLLLYKHLIPRFQQPVLGFSNHGFPSLPFMPHSSCVNLCTCTALLCARKSWDALFCLCVYVYVTLVGQNELRNTEMLSAACAVGVGCCFAAPIGGKPTRVQGLIKWELWGQI